MFDEYEEYDGLGLAELVKKGEVSAKELLGAAIERCEARNPRLNAVVHTMYDEAERTVERGVPEGPFEGVPFLLKDLLAAYAGAPLTDGCKGLASYVPDYDSELVTRFKKTGVVIFGKTNTPELGLLGYTEPELHGPTRNPWNLEKTPGGSSGGSAAAVAGGITPLAAGGDGGGSIRIPSSYCGLFGMKPSRGRTPTGPYLGQIWQGAVVEHVITRSVRDSAAMLDATCEPDRGAFCLLQRSEEPYLQAMQKAPRALKIAFSTQSPVGADIHPEIAHAVHDTARTLEKLGHSVEEKAPQIDGQALALSYVHMNFGEVAAEVDAMEAKLKRRARPEDFETVTWTLNLLGKALSASRFITEKRRWDQASRQMSQLFESFDLYLTPTVAQPPFGIAELIPSSLELLGLKLVNTLRLERLLLRLGVMEKIAIQNLAKAPFTQLANLTGLPAMSVPLHETSDGLPCGMQFMAPMGDEATLFQLAHQLEVERPWMERRPSLR